MAQEGSTPRAATSGSVGSVRLLGVPIRLHFTFVLLLICLVVVGLSSNQSPGNYTLFVLAVIASVLLHEFGHAFVSSLYGIRTLEIVMYPIGGVARLERPPKPWEEFWIALTGPVINLGDRRFHLRHALFGEARGQSLRASAAFRCESGRPHRARESDPGRIQSAARISHGRRPHAARSSFAAEIGIRGHAHRHLVRAHAGHQHGTLWIHQHADAGLRRILYLPGRGQ